MVVLGLVISVFWISVRLHEVFFRLEVNLCVFDKVGKDASELLLPLPFNHGLVQFIDDVHQVFVLHIDNANLDAIGVTPGEKLGGRGSHIRLLRQYSASLDESTWQGRFVGRFLAAGLHHQ
jgi:hypothetical protein